MPSCWVGSESCRFVVILLARQGDWKTAREFLETALAMANYQVHLDPHLRANLLHDYAQLIERPGVTMRRAPLKRSPQLLKGTVQRTSWWTLQKHAKNVRRPNSFASCSFNLLKSLTIVSGLFYAADRLVLRFGMRTRSARQLSGSTGQISESTRGWVVAATAAAGLFFGAFPTVVFSFGIFFQSYVQEFHAGRGDISMAFTLHNLTAAVLAGWIGGLADRFGARAVILPGLAALGGILLLAPAIGSQLWQLYVFYIALGAVAGATTSAPYSLTVSRWFNRRRGLALGLMMIGIGAGAIVMPPLLAPPYRRIWMADSLRSGRMHNSDRADSHGSPVSAGRPQACRLASRGGIELGAAAFRHRKASPGNRSGGRGPSVS